jgi:hypothetical protein
MNSSRTTRQVLFAFVFLAACSGKEGGTGPSAVPASISKTAGDNQTGTAGTVLPVTLVVTVRDANGSPVSNARVQWDAGTGSGSPQPGVSFSNSQGQATSQWSLGPIAGTARVSAQVGGVTPVVFSATVLPGPVAQVVSLPDVATLGVGDTVRIRTSTRDQFGNVVSGQAITYSTPDAAIATVSSVGLVTAVAEGSARIIATAGTRADTVLVTVLAAGASPCGTTPRTVLAVGQVFNATTLGNSTRVCLVAPADATADFGMVLVFAASTFSTTLVADLYGINVAGPTSPNALLGLRSVLADQSLQQQLQLSLDGPLVLDREAERRRRELERRELSGLREIARERFGARDGVAASMQPKVAKVGDILRLNSNPLSACENPDSRVGRVAAVGSKSIIVADTANPAGGYTDAEYASIAATFDTLIYPMGTEAFGTPTDISGYGKIILFYTRAVNALTPPSSGFVIGGFFFARDLYPKTARNNLPACPASNEAEMFYLLVPDPSGSINSNPRSKAQVTQLNIGTIAHEFQHLINSSRRLYVNTGGAVAEETWLDEGISHVAEELLYLRLAGYTSRQNLTLQDVAGTTARNTIFSNYGIQNFGRLYDYLRNPETNSPYAQNDSLATRGAIWSFLRYAAAREGAAGEAQFLRRIVNSTTSGLTNLASAIPSNQLADYLRDWSISNIADDYSAEVMATLGSQYINPAWNFRSIFPGLRVGGQPLGTYPLSTRTLFSNIPQRITLPGGATSYIRFSVAAAKEGVVSLSSNGGALPTTARVAVVRLR